MLKHRVTFKPADKAVHVPEGTTLFNAAHWAGMPIDSTCGGRGTCGKCRVHIEEGAFEPTAADHRHLEDSLDEGWRLSCQAMVGSESVCEVPRLLRTPKAATMGVGRFVLLEPNVAKHLVEVAPPTLEDARPHVQRIADQLQETEGIEIVCDPTVLPRIARAFADEPANVTCTLVGDRLIDVEPGDTRDRMFGVSFDLGTTTVVATLLDLRTGAAAAVASTINRQAPYGADVIARMGHSMLGDAELEELRASSVQSLNGLLDEVCESAKANREDIYEVVVVGNATMLHLLLGVHPRSIAVSPFVATFLEPQELKAADAGLRIHPEGRMSLFPSLGAYVGADIVSDIVATGLAQDDKVRLLIDVGTNGEIVCGNRDRSAATAAPAGPAFEGGQILHGMRATDGAIEGVVLENGAVELQVIGDAEPAGICGSGLIDVVAQLRLTGLLTESGTFISPDAAASHPLGDRLVERNGVRAFALTDDVVLTQLDVRELQSAKGAIATGIQVAMRHLGLNPEDLDEVDLAGSFGTYINPRSALVLGLVPPVPVERIKAVGNTASEGAKMALMSFRERQIAFELPRFVEYVELSGIPDFNDMFIANLAFPSLDAEPASARASA